jgi:hypothetical protein
MNFNHKKWLWAGRIMTALGTLFMLFDGIVHLLRIAPVVQAFQQMGYSSNVIVPLAIIELISVVLYMIPRTSILGVILLTGYLGGAVDSNVHAGNPLSIILSPVYVAIVLWGGLYLRDSRLRMAIPFGKS